MPVSARTARIRQINLVPDTGLRLTNSVRTRPYNLKYPPDRPWDDPQRNSEAEVDDQPARSGHAGQAPHDLTDVPEAPELDFRVWLEGVGWFDLEVKGGR